MSRYTRKKTPHFFMYAKDKKKEAVEPVNNSTVNKLKKIIVNKNINFDFAGIGVFNWRVLVTEDLEELDQDIIDLYEKVNDNKYSTMNNSKDIENFLYINIQTLKQFLELNLDIAYIVNNLVKYVYAVKKSKNKKTLWDCFGEYIYNNVENNCKKENVHCIECDNLIPLTINKMYCEECAKEEHKRIDREYQKKKYQEKKLKKENSRLNPDPLKPLQPPQ